MTIVNFEEIGPNLLDYRNFKLAVKNSQKQILITMSMMYPYFHTGSLPHTHDVLKNTLPQVLDALCFNDSNLPFDMEVKNTEIGHLFEHILLEYLCELKVKNGHLKASFRGLTKWDWKKDSLGTYHIQIEVQPEDLEYFDLALEKSIKLLNKILVGKEKSALSLLN